MTRPIPAHYIRENHDARVPKRLVCIDTQAVQKSTGDTQTHTWRCAAAVFIHWTERGNRVLLARTYDDPEALWRDIADFTRPKARTVVYAHNVPYHLRISKALYHLPKLGFTLEAIRVAQAGSWSRWTKGKRPLAICDSASIFPVTIWTLGKLGGKPKMAVPPESGTHQWMDYALRNADIVASAVAAYWDWLREGHAGNWQMTGAGQSWSHWRHSHYTDPVLVHGDADAVAAERRAMWAGRAEAWHWGKNTETPIYEWDWANAYPSIARDNELPSRLAGKTGEISVSQLRQLLSRYAVLADLSVETDLPIVPAKVNQRILWPVGSFQTTIWDPEIELLIRSGAKLQVHRTWLYQRSHFLRQWGQWVLGELGFHKEGRPPWLGILLKHWSRTLIGKFATQYQNWEEFGTDDCADVRMGVLFDTRTQQRSEFMQIGQALYSLGGMTESDDSCPQVTSYVMSIGRANLWRALCAVGFGNVLYMDTDSLIVGSEGNARLESLTQRGLFPGLRCKSRQRGYEIFGPRAAVLGTNTIMSGMSRGSQRIDDTTWRGEVYTSMERAIRDGEADRVTTRQRTFRTGWNEHRRARMADGRTTPYRLPEHVPAEPTGAPPASTGAERQEAARKALRARKLTGQSSAVERVGGGGDHLRRIAGLSGGR